MAALTRRAAIASGTGLAAAVSASMGAASAWAAVPAKGWPVAPGDMSIGNPKAPVHVVEYLSLTCPHCAHFHETVFPGFKTKYIDTGRVYFTIRELLTAPAQVAAAGFLLARCNGGKNYFAVVDQVFRSQSRWQSGSIKPIFVEIAKQNGLTEAQFDACVSDDAAGEALEKRIAYATGVDKVQSTPTFFVNGKLLDNDHVPDMADLDAAIAKALAPTGRR